MQPTVISGGINNKLMTLKLSKEDFKRYELLKMAAWLVELEKGFIVKKFKKPTKKGTEYTFFNPKTSEEYVENLKLFKEYIIEIQKNDFDDAVLREIKILKKILTLHISRLGD